MGRKKSKSTLETNLKKPDDIRWRNYLTKIDHAPFEQKENKNIYKEKQKQLKKDFGAFSDNTKTQKLMN